MLCNCYIDIEPEAVAQNGLKEWVDLLQLFVENNFTHKSETTGRSVQFTYKGVEVDLLVSPYWNTSQEFYQFLNKIPRERRGMYANLFIACAIIFISYK